jgi:hypothetical protein
VTGYLVGSLCIRDSCNDFVDTPFGRHA